MTTTSMNPGVRWAPVRASVWEAELDGGHAGAIERTVRGRFVALDSAGRALGSYPSFVSAKERVAAELAGQTEAKRASLGDVLLAVLATVVGIGSIGVAASALTSLGALTLR
ncbi:hypothetical protein [Desertivibrio insolitus]|uniref:hypothetical protein n=1 Tax=Herbiconiux sp. SYSU D00978 TaxID=2812562 RepID=UPI001A9760DB|nr:hypothetical protein [Herbiconiux sp. SYSU D00978]